MAKTSNIRKPMRCEGFFRLVITAAILAVAAMWAAPSHARNAADGYRFEQAEFVRTDFAVKVVEYDSAKEVTQAAESAGALLAPTQVGNYGRSVSSRVLAWSRIRDDVCEIHIIKPTVEYRPDLFGHELAHCIYGRWHPSKP